MDVPSEESKANLPLQSIEFKQISHSKYTKESIKTFTGMTNSTCLQQQYINIVDQPRKKTQTQHTESESISNNKKWILTQIYKAHMNLDLAIQFLNKKFQQQLSKEQILLDIQQQIIQFEQNFNELMSKKQRRNTILNRMLANLNQSKQLKDDQIAHISQKQEQSTLQIKVEEKSLNLSIEQKQKKINYENQKENNIDQANKNTFQCPICLNKYKHKQTVNLTQKCGHYFCTKCYTNYLKETISKDQVINIKCPQDECQEVLSHELLIKCLPKKLLQKYNYSFKSQQIKINPEIKFCSSPDCKGVFTKEEQNNQFATCKFCKIEKCMLCGENRHDKVSCEEIIDQYFQAFCNVQQIQKCPYCKISIQKISGCNHVICGNCNYQFCWLCRKKYSKYHYKHWNIFGCQGQLFEQKKMAFTKKCLLFLACIGKIFICILGMALFPLILVACAFMLPTFISITYWPTWYHSFDDSDEQQLKRYFILVLSSIIMFPFSLIFSIIPGTCMILNEAYEYINDDHS